MPGSYPESASSSRGGPSTARPYSGHASLRHSQSCSAPPSASLAGCSHVGQRGGSALMRDSLSRMDTKVNLAEKLALLDAPFQPGIVGTLNDYKLAVVKVDGEFVWHKHADTAAFFLVLSGPVTIQLRDRDVELGPGDLFVVPRGVEHCPRADEPAEVLLIEPLGTTNTGDTGGDLTAPERPV